MRWSCCRPARHCRASRSTSWSACESAAIALGCTADAAVLAADDAGASAEAYDEPRPCCIKYPIRSLPFSSFLVSPTPNGRCFLCGPRDRIDYCSSCTCSVLPTRAGGSQEGAPHARLNAGPLSSSSSSSSYVWNPSSEQGLLAGKGAASFSCRSLCSKPWDEPVS